jgi:hypothetical protein
MMVANADVSFVNLFTVIPNLSVINEMKACKKWGCPQHSPQNLHFHFTRTPHACQ